MVKEKYSNANSKGLKMQTDFDDDGEKHCGMKQTEVIKYTKQITAKRIRHAQQ